MSAVAPRLRHPNRSGLHLAPVIPISPISPISSNVPTDPNGVGRPGRVGDPGQPRCACRLAVVDGIAWAYSRRFGWPDPADRLAGTRRRRADRPRPRPWTRRAVGRTSYREPYLPGEGRSPLERLEQP